MMKMTAILPMILLAAAGLNGQYGESRQQAAINPAPGPGRCLVEAEVDGTVQISMRDREATARVLAGQPIVWRRFECSQPIPRNPEGLRLARTDGRGETRLTNDARRDGLAVVQIQDPKGGSGHYSFTIEWQSNDEPGNQGGQFSNDDRRGRGGQPFGTPDPYGPERDQNRDRGDRRQQAVRRCADAVQDRLSRDEYRDVRISAVSAEDRPGRRGDRILGRATGQSRWGIESFLFSCSVNFEEGGIRSVDVVPQ